jgi:ankyrin repeat protein
MSAAQLVEAVHIGNLAEVQRLVHGGVDVNEVTGVLHMAVRRQHFAMVRFLLEEGADPDMYNDNGNALGKRCTALYIAACSSTVVSHNADTSVALARLLLDHGANVNMPELAWRETALQRAAESGSAALVRLLLERGADANLQSRYGDTALLYAATRSYEINQEEILRLLLKEGAADVNIQDNRRRTPLHWARGLRSVTILLESGADVAIQDDEGKTALFSALATLGALAALGQRYHESEVQSEAAAVRCLLKHGADANAEWNVDGKTHLQRAVLKGNSRAVQVLLDHGANAMVRDEDGDTPLHVACAEGHLDCIFLLLQHGIAANSVGLRR